MIEIEFHFLFCSNEGVYLLWIVNFVSITCIDVIEQSSTIHW